MSQLYDLYRAVGNDNYGTEISRLAPYFGTIEPRFVSLWPGYCEIAIKNAHSIHNHLGTIHAIAMCNGAELVAGIMTDVSIPDGRRWIPTGMTVEYLAKAKTDLRVVADGAALQWDTLGDLVVPVDIFDDSNTRVFTARITMNIKVGR